MCSSVSPNLLLIPSLECIFFSLYLLYSLVLLILFYNSFLKFFLCLSNLSFSSVQFSHSVMSNSLQPHESQHARSPYPSPTPRFYSNSYTSSLWCHPAISSSVVPFSSCPQSLPASGFFQWVNSLHEVAKLHMSWSFSFSISPSNEHPGLISFRMDWLDLLSVQGTLKSLLQHPQFKSINFSVLSFLHSPTLTSIHDHWKKP